MIWIPITCGSNRIVLRAIHRMPRWTFCDLRVISCGGDVNWSPRSCDLSSFKLLPLGYLKLYAIFLTSTLNQVLYYIAIIFHLLKIRLLILVYLLFSHNTSIFLFILYTKFKIITENKPFVMLFNVTDPESRLIR